MNPNYPHYLAGVPPELGAYPGAVAAHNLPAGLNNYPRPPMQMNFDGHPSMRAPPLTSALMLPGGKA